MAVRRINKKELSRLKSLWAAFFYGWVQFFAVVFALVMFEDRLNEFGRYLTLAVVTTVVMLGANGLMGIMDKRKIFSKREWLVTHVIQSFGMYAGLLITLGFWLQLLFREGVELSLLAPISLTFVSLIGLTVNLVFLRAKLKKGELGHGVVN